MKCFGNEKVFIQICRLKTQLLKIAKTKSELLDCLHSYRKRDFKIGLVPTMGALHEGHLSLISASKASCDLTVVSIFVNPTQFNELEDLQSYPKPIAEDIQLLEQEGCDVLFHPTVEELYEADEHWDYEVGDLNRTLEGAFRPGHYKGVTQVVYKLFDLVKPDKAFFGQKDYQQFLVIKKMNDDLELSVHLVSCPVVRERSGLAMSSRNTKLNGKEKERGTVIFESLMFVKEHYHQFSLKELQSKARSFYQGDGKLRLEYFKICDKNTLMEKTEKDENGAIALVACFVGGTRLIDNMMLP